MNKTSINTRMTGIQGKDLEHKLLEIMVVGDKDKKEIGCCPSPVVGKL